MDIISSSFEDSEDKKVEQFVRIASSTFKTYKHQDQTLKVKRKIVRFNGQKCKMLTFSDKTSQSLLSRAEEKIRYLLELNTAVRHEMVGPLQASVELSRRMISHTIDPQVRADGKLILFSSNLVLYLINDLLD